MNSDMQQCLAIYQQQLNEGTIRKAYIILTKYVSELKKNFPQTYKTSSLTYGYLDYTYFSFTDDYLRNSQLRFALVLNHQKLQIKLWLVGRTAGIQERYWNLMKDSKWNKGIETKPIYAILEAVLKAPIDFSDKEKNDTKYSQAGAIHIVGNR